MSLYSDYSAARTRQIIADLIGLVSVAIVITIGVLVTTTIRAFAAFGRDLETAGLDFQTGLTDAAEALGDVPLIGDGIRGPFDLAADAGAAVADAGRSQQALVETVAIGTGATITIVPLLLIALVWLVPRIRFARRSTELRTLIDRGMSADTLAVRALGRASLRDLAAVHPDPAAAWRDRDVDVVRALAAIELRRAGIKPKALP
ncbi:MAG: hypothetical protein KIT89_02945 [Microcella sp.]|uniref:hypothetical protein n=1 Tax=Microcella sp. TaxID=1913979 RepID=UPI0024C7DA27|nr:hypothetical protein [Microcella sp.]UYN84180.1 MAG: hypothetical protein KIT89_02945 [Microcella sp.]